LGIQVELACLEAVQRLLGSFKALFRHA
jgi:hypothetical protein